MKTASEKFKSEHFELCNLKPGIYAAISNLNGAAVGNAGLIDLGDRTLVFDTFLTPQAAADLKRMALELTGRQPELVINSHYHNDHIWGNQVFQPGALLLSADRTRQLITIEGQEELEWYSARAQTELEELQRSQDGQRSAAAQEMNTMWLGYYRGLVEALPTLRVCLPDMTFPDRFTIHGSDRRVELYSFQDGHTGCDTVLHLPEDEILFTADLLFVESHPFLAEGDPHKLIEILKTLQQLPAGMIVPGHGPVGTRDDFARLIGYVKDCIAIAQDIIRNGGQGEDAAKDIALPSAYQHWMLPTFFRLNMKFLLRQLSE